MNDDWRPIKTVPRDGTPVLVFEPGNGEGFDTMSVALWKRFSLVLQEDDHLVPSATHWQPLPNPPEKKR